MKIQIKHRETGSVLFETDAETIGAAVAAAIQAKADLRYADLSYADLSYADLRYADLSYADLRYADLRYADLRYANLRYADLSYANLRYANLSSADLSYANLRSADLSYADLSYANLRYADLRSADLSYANLRYANLSSAKNLDLKVILPTSTILPDGDLIGWKKLLGGLICKLRIPADAARVGGLVGRKCRAQWADVLELEGATKGRSGRSEHNSAFIYKAGQRVTPDKWDPNPLVECSSGIHFYITKQEAIDH